MKQRWLAWPVVALGMVICRAAFLEDVVYNIDETEYAVAAHGLDHGWLPGVDLLGTTKPPGAAVLYNVLFHLFGPSLTAAHVTQTVVMIAAGIAVIELAIALWGLTAALPAAFLWWVLCNSYGLPPEMFSLNVESPGLVLLAPALLLVWKRPQRRWSLIAAGGAVGCAALFRQSYAVFLLPLMVAVWAIRPQRLKRAVGTLAGFALPWVITGIVYASSGGLAWAWDSWVRYPLTYAGDVGVSGFMQALLINGTEFFKQAIMPLCLAVFGCGLLMQRWPSARTKFVAATVVASFLALCAGSRFWGHYWLQVYPALAVTGVYAWLWLNRRFARYRVAVSGAIVIAGLILGMRLPTWRTWDFTAPPRGISYSRLDDEQTEREIGRFAMAHTASDETIVVWGYCPQIYYYARRLPGVRDYLCHYITGYSPGSFDPFTERAPREQGHSMAQRMFIEDLEQRRPKYVFDLVLIDDYPFTFLNYSLRDYPDLASYMRETYLPEGQVGRALVYRRRTAQDTWIPDAKDVE
ncbi:MAG TPA: hypothetical protein VGL38_10450 [bacterium]